MAGVKRKLDLEKGELILNEGQQQFIEWLVDPERSGSQSDFARSIGVAPKTLTQWKRDGSFRAEWERRCADLNIDPGRVQAVVDNMWKTASCSKDPKKVEAAKMYLEYINKFTPTKRVVVEDKSIKDMSDEEIAEALEAGAGHLRAVK